MSEAVKEISAMSDEELERMVGWLVGRTHVSTSDKGIRSWIGRKLNKSVQGEDRKRVLDAAVRVHHNNRDFFKRMRF